MAQPESRKALTTLMAEYRPLIVRAVQRAAPRLPGLTGEDIEQEVGLKLWNALQRGRKIEFPPSYIARMTATVIVDLARKAEARPNPTEDLDDHESEWAIADEDFEQKNLVVRVMQAVAELPEQQRAAVNLKLQGCTGKDMARITQWSQGKCESLAKRGMKALRARLEELENADDYG